VNRFNISDKLSCWTGEIDSLCADPEDAAEYVSVKFCKWGGGGGVVGIDCRVCCWVVLWVGAGDTCYF